MCTYNEKLAERINDQLHLLEQSKTQKGHEVSVLFGIYGVKSVGLWDNVVKKMDLGKRRKVGSHI